MCLEVYMKILRNTSFGILGFLLLLAIFIEIKDGYLLLFFWLRRAFSIYCTHQRS